MPQDGYTLWMPQAVLICHPSSPCAAIERIEVNVTATGQRLAVRYRLAGTIDRIVVPAAAMPQRQDGLWRHTCAEMFVGALGSSGYHEFNFSPSGHWAAYGFDSFREGMVHADISAPRIVTTHAPNELNVDVEIDLPTFVALAERSRCALSCVVEETGGRLSFWALQHAPGDKPDFHHSNGFVFKMQ